MPRTTPSSQPRRSNRLASKSSSIPVSIALMKSTKEPKKQQTTTTIPISIPSVPEQITISPDFKYRCSPYYFIGLEPFGIVIFCNKCNQRSCVSPLYQGFITDLCLLCQHQQENDKHDNDIIDIMTTFPMW